MNLITKPISWIKAARKDFEKFPEGIKQQDWKTNSFAAEVFKAYTAKPMKGLGSGIFEIALQYKSNAWRVVYAVQIGEDIWGIHAFQKKSKTGIKTPKQEIDLIKQRIATLKEMLK